MVKAVCCACAAHCSLKGRSPIVVILSRCPFVDDDTAGIGIRQSFVVSMFAVRHPYAIPGSCPGLSHDAFTYMSLTQ